ncbi:MAG: tyrosine-type recombinase/integrase [Chitinophagales bacterium]|nr:tyrosine-type recombinase/integrase [Chitinophagales bacterium]
MSQHITLYKVCDTYANIFIGLRIERNTPEMHLVKSCKGRIWSPEAKLWLLPYTKEAWHEIKSKLPNISVCHQVEEVRIEPIALHGSKNYTKKVPSMAGTIVEFSQAHEEALLRMREELIVRRYQMNTQRNYLSCFREYLAYYPDCQAADLNKEDIRSFLLHKIENDHISEATQNALINAIKFFYEHVEKRERFVIYDLRPRKPKKLPGFLSKDEVARIIRSIKNEKHQLIIKLIYSAGLRLGEIIRLRRNDINEANNCILIRCGKGKKDRIVTLSAKIKEDLRSYIDKYRPRYYLIEGQDGGPYSPRSVQNIFTDALVRACITTHATVHTLRHSYATHLILDGTDIRIVQELLGHNSLKTTEIYTHITDKWRRNIKSQLDSLDI